MPRLRRTIRPGDLVHVISRFVNREFRLTGPVERAEYLRRLGACVSASDWHVVSFALMSSHIHLGLVAGRESFEGLFKRTHAPFAGWLNRRQRRLGPVFAERPKSLVVHPVWAARLIAYHHNNPARAGVVRRADESAWTSHRAYVDAVPGVAHLSVDLGLELMGFGANRAGRLAFADYVMQRRDEPRDTMLTGEDRRARRELREALGAAVRIEHPSTGPDGLDYSASIEAERWNGRLAEVVNRVSLALGLRPLEITSRRRRRDLVAARRSVVLTAGMLGRTNTEVGLLLGVSEGAVRKLRKTASAREAVEARRLAAELAGES